TCGYDPEVERARPSGPRARSVGADPSVTTRPLGVTVTAVLAIGLLLNLIALPIAGRRVWFLERLITSGQPAPDRVEGVTGRMGMAVKTQVVEVFGQKKLLKWSVPGAARFFVFWAFLIL